jgi:hypothetical protein
MRLLVCLRCSGVVIGVTLVDSALSWLDIPHYLSRRYRLRRSGWFGSGGMTLYQGVVYAVLICVGILPRSR